MTIQELRDFFLYLEEKYDLLDLEIDGIKPWQLQRVSIDYHLGRTCGLMQSPHTALGFKDKIYHSLSLIKNMIIYNPFFASKAEVLIISSPRVKQEEGIYIDPYTHYLLQEFKAENTKVIELESPLNGKHLPLPQKDKFYIDFIFICRRVFSRLIRIQNPQSEILKKVEAEISEKIGRYDLSTFLYQTVKLYKVEYRLYYKLLQKISPQKIYVVVGYSFGALIKAAKDLGIETIELQHGNFSKFHFGYYYGEGKRKLEYFPDKILVWNRYWKQRINFPIRDENVQIRPFTYLEQRKKVYCSIKKIKKQAVVLSQGVLGDMIAQRIYENWDYFQKFKLIYKLHPGEYSRYRSYTHLMKLQQEYSVEVITECDLYTILAASSYQIGVFSTALYEGVEFGCKTILLDLPGIEEMKVFKRMYQVEVV